MSQIRRPDWLHPPSAAPSAFGVVAGAWLVWYAIARSICEFFREPETVHALNLGPFTAGQFYSLPMFLLGVYFIYRARSTPPA